MSSIGGAGISAALYAVVSNPAQVAAQPAGTEERAHHLKNGKGFTNPWDSYVESSPWKIVSTLLWRKISGQGHSPDTTPPTVPVRAPDLHPTRSTPKLRATWLGHACYLVEFPGGFRVLFDPVFEDCCTPIPTRWHKRYTPPPCEIEDIPFVDAVVISHNHYDHLSYPTIQRISKRFPEAHFFAPLGNKAWFEKCGITKVTELDWWESRDIRLEEVLSKKSGSSSSGGGGSGKSNNHEGVSVSESEHDDGGKGIKATIGALPCQHISARTPFDKCKTLWASWSVESGGAKVWFGGSDTGYRAVPSLPVHTDDYSPAYAHLPVCPAFAQIGTHRGPFDLGLIPIGAYEPRWMWSAVHADPKDAVNIFVDTKCRRALGMHWGTWVLTEEDVLEPPRKLKEALRWKGLDEESFGVCDIGEAREFESRGR
ncbi:hypothetical protein ACEQ8H_004071 [Pleosporales sp. CAS-2024a]